jgi:hypothetical protein
LKIAELMRKCSEHTSTLEVVSSYCPRMGYRVHWRASLSGKLCGNSDVIDALDLRNAPDPDALVGARTTILLEGALKVLESHTESLLSPEERRLRTLEKALADATRRIEVLEARD